MRIDFTRGIYANIDVVQDTYAEDPRREMDMAKFYLAESQHEFIAITEEIEIGTDDIANLTQGHVVEIDGKLYMGLERYRHGGEVYAICGEGNFPDRRWDVSPIAGFITPDEVMDSDAISSYNRMKEGGDQEGAEVILKKRLNQDISTFNQWLSGEVYGYDVSLHNSDGEDLSSDSCWGFYGDEDYCLGEAKDTAYNMALRVMTQEEIEENLKTASSETGGLPKYIKEWYLRVWPTEDLDLDWAVATVAMKAYDYITETHLKDANPGLLIARVKGSVWDDYPEHPQEDWRMEAANGDTVLGYWEWVKHRLVECSEEI